MLKELKGTITARVLSEPETVIIVTDLAKAKTFKGGEDGYIKVTDVTKGKDGQLDVRFEMQKPSGHVPEWAPSSSAACPARTAAAAPTASRWLTRRTRSCQPCS